MQIAEIRELFDTLRATGSTLTKVSLLRKFIQDPRLRALLKLHSDPYLQFYIAKLPLERPSVPGGPKLASDLFKTFLAMAGSLASRTLSGHEALAYVYDFFARCTEDETEVYRTILLREPLNIAAGLLNEAEAGFVPKFTLMLAENKVITLAKVVFPVVAQPKLDGFRAVYFPAYGFIGRNGQATPNTQVHKVFEELAKSGYVLDGELYSDDMSFNAISSALRSEDGSLEGIHYCVYDALQPDEWEKQLCQRAYDVRIEAVRKVVKTYSRLPIRLIESVTLTSSEELTAFYQQKLQEGYEGLMLKAPNGLYQWKRVTIKSGVMSKLKPHMDWDGQILGFEEGTGKNKGSLGALVLRVEGITDPVKVGTGFGEDERDYIWKYQEKLMGQWVKLKASEVTEGSKSLRFPRFVSLRDAKE